VLAAFKIPILQSIPADSGQQAMLVAQEIGFPVAMKVDSPDITHKTDVGGVRLGVSNAREVRNVYLELTSSIANLRPDAKINGVVIEPMWKGRHARELMIGIIRDEVFGPVISFGMGGTMVEIMRDKEVALPPLNQFLVDSLIDRTRAAKLLKSMRGAPAVDRAALEDLLLRVSEMACELPSIVEMDMNPVIANADGVVAVDARIVVARHNEASLPYEHMAIHPYPKHLVQEIDLVDGSRVTIRPIRPEDAVIEREFVNGLSEQSRYFRFMYALPEITPELLSRFTQIDYDRDMALIATIMRDGKEIQVGVARYNTMSDPASCEFAIVVADDWQNKGIARSLMADLVRAARSRRFTRMLGTVLKKNTRMIEFSRALGFEMEASTEDHSLMEVVLDL
jgi:acetyltransferase